MAIPRISGRFPFQYSFWLSTYSRIVLAGQEFNWSLVIIHWLGDILKPAHLRFPLSLNCCDNVLDLSKVDLTGLWRHFC